MSDVKLIRKQIRNVLQEEGSALFNSEAFKAGLTQLQAQVSGRLNDLEKKVMESLAQIEERNKDVQNFIMRAVTAPAPAQESNTDAQAALLSELTTPAVEPTKTE